MYGYSVMAKRVRISSWVDYIIPGFPDEYGISASIMAVPWISKYISLTFLQT